jgi:hypothetical protein
MDFWKAMLSNRVSSIKNNYALSLQSISNIVKYFRSTSKILKKDDPQTIEELIDLLPDNMFAISKETFANGKSTETGIIKYIEYNFDFVSKFFKYIDPTILDRPIYDELYKGFIAFVLYYGNMVYRISHDKYFNLFYNYNFNKYVIFHINRLSKEKGIIIEDVKVPLEIKGYKLLIAVVADEDKAILYDVILNWGITPSPDPPNNLNTHSVYLIYGEI